MFFFSEIIFVLGASVLQMSFFFSQGSHLIWFSLLHVLTTSFLSTPAYMEDASLGEVKWPTSWGRSILQGSNFVALPLTLFSCTNSLIVQAANAFGQYASHPVSCRQAGKWLDTNFFVSFFTSFFFLAHVGVQVRCVHRGWISLQGSD